MICCQHDRVAQPFYLTCLFYPLGVRFCTTIGHTKTERSLRCHSVLLALLYVQIRKREERIRRELLRECYREKQWLPWTQGVHVCRENFSNKLYDEDLTHCLLSESRCLRISSPAPVQFT